MSYTDILKQMKPDINVFYKTVGDLKLPLQVFLPDDFKETNKYKAIIAIHGGGWHSLTETPAQWDGSDMIYNARDYARKGYVGIIFSYRHYKLDENTDIGDIIKDCHDALRFVKDNFSFIDEEDVLFMGDSAGGHLALCLGMCLPEGAQPPIKPSKIAAYNPVTDCVCDKWNYCAEDAIKYSPMHNIKPIDAEVLVMHGTKDVVVDIQDSRLFVEKMKARGNNISMIEVSGAGHAFILFECVAAEEDVLKAIKVTDEYFNL